VSDTGSLIRASAFRLASASHGRRARGWRRMGLLDRAHLPPPYAFCSGTTNR
jgi:hypothetical protein